MKGEVLEILEAMMEDVARRLEQLRAKPLSPHSKALMEAHLVGQLSALAKLKRELERLSLFNNKK